VPGEIFKVSQIIGRGDDTQTTVRDFNLLVTELNKMLSEVAITIGKLGGRDGATAKFAGDLDVQNHALLNVSQVRFAASQHATNSIPFRGVYEVGDPTDAPVTPDELRDDLADNVLPVVEAALNDLGTNLKRVLDVLKI